MCHEVDMTMTDSMHYFPSPTPIYFSFRNRSPMLDHCIVAVKALAYKNGLTVEMQDRFMNKNGGIEGCPMLTHLVKDSPYIAIGLNDTITGIHQPNESIDVNRISLAIQQFTEFLHAAATASV